LRNLYLWFAAGLGVLTATFAFAVLRIAVAESLWLDELHTSWSVSGSWQEIASRAAAGNQTPLYFWSVGAVSQTLGLVCGQQSEWMLRLPSVTAWLLTLALAAWLIQSKVIPRDPRRWLFAMCIVAWIVLDRLQWFFASEARPYACVQLVSLAGWCCIEALVQMQSQPNRDQATARSKLKLIILVVAWSSLSIVNIYLHLTAALPVLFQWLTAGGLVGWQQYRMRRENIRAARLTSSMGEKSQLDQRVGEKGASVRSEECSGQWSQATFSGVGFQVKWVVLAGGVLLALLPILQLAFPVWHRRGQWATFASDVSVSRATSMFPFLPVLLCVAIGCAVDLALRSDLARTRIAVNVRCVWWIAMLGPWLSAWAITALGIAPMFHQRFVFASAVPVFIVGAIELLRCRQWTLRWIVCIAVAVAMLFTQGSVSIWRAGYLVGNLRGEDWRSATQWVSSQRLPAEPLLCSSGLIEANSTRPFSLPLDASFEEYLAFPLLGVYRVAEPTGHYAAVTALLGDHHQWAAQVGERLARESIRPDRLWLFYRGAPGRLKSKLAEFQVDLKARKTELEASEPRRFGSVLVVELRLAR
jgi:mannosyltransferase